MQPLGQSLRLVPRACGPQQVVDELGSPEYRELEGRDGVPFPHVGVDGRAGIDQLFPADGELWSEGRGNVEPRKVDGLVRESTKLREATAGVRREVADRLATEGIRQHLPCFLARDG